MVVAMRSSMKRSWVTSTSPPSNAVMLSSSTSSVGMSRSLVGSSRISRSAGPSNRGREAEGGLHLRARDVDARLLAARQPAHRHLEVLGQEEEPLGPGCHVEDSPLEMHAIALGSQCPAQRLLG